VVPPPQPTNPIAKVVTKRRAGRGPEQFMTFRDDCQAACRGHSNDTRVHTSLRLFMVYSPCLKSQVPDTALYPIWPRVLRSEELGCHLTPLSAPPSHDVWSPGQDQTRSMGSRNKAIQAQASATCLIERGYRKVGYSTQR